MRAPPLVLLAAVTLSLGFAPVPPPKERKLRPGEITLKALEGTWTVVSYEVGRVNPKGRILGRRPIPVKAMTSYQTVEIKGGKWTQVRTLAKGRTSRTLPYSIVLDASQSPGTFDLANDRLLKTKAKGKALARRTVSTRKGVARLDGDQLTVTYSAAGRDRPAAVDAELTTGQYRWVLRRQRP